MKVLKLSKEAKKILDRERELFDFGKDYYKLFDEVVWDTKEVIDAMESGIIFDYLPNGNFLVQTRTFADIYPTLTREQEARKRIVELLGDLPRIELFARERVEGWDVWGNEV